MALANVLGVVLAGGIRDAPDDQLVPGPGQARGVGVGPCQSFEHLQPTIVFDGMSVAA